MIVGSIVGSIVAIAAAEGLLIVAMAAGWLVQRRLNNAGWVDVFWTFGVGLAGIMVALWPVADSGAASRRGLVAALVAAWMLRLGVHVALRVARSPEDLRYVAFRKEWGADFERRLFWFMQRQAWGSILFVIAIAVAAHHPAPTLRVADAIGAAILIVAIAGEWTADLQLQHFKRDPANRGRLCDTGLWSLSRHPNYFFEWFGWLAYPLIAIDLAGGYWQGFLALGAPLLMYWVVVHGTGIPPLEAHMLRSRGDAFRRYQSRTRAFFPFPRTGGNAS